MDLDGRCAIENRKSPRKLAYIYRILSLLEGTKSLDTQVAYRTAEGSCTYERIRFLRQDT